MHISIGSFLCLFVFLTFTSLAALQSMTPSCVCVSVLLVSPPCHTHTHRRQERASAGGKKRQDKPHIHGKLCRPEPYQYCFPPIATHTRTRTPHIISSYPSNIPISVQQLQLHCTATTKRREHTDNQSSSPPSPIISFDPLIIPLGDPK
jgi:hypothetical protein